MIMNFGKLLSPRFYMLNKSYKEMIQYDYQFNAEFRGTKKLSRKFLKGYEWRYISLYRKYQSNYDNIWGMYFGWRLERLENKTGFSFERNINIGRGLIIGHWGKIVLNSEAKFGDEVFLTHGVTIGRDVRGKRKGVPTVGNRVCIRANSTVVGNVHIGNDVLIAPNTFVNFDVPDHSIVIGNPASIHDRENATEGHLPHLV